jgi:8-oxo-dGTP pyrophosphatase MutT (NUDIX family)
MELDCFHLGVKALIFSSGNLLLLKRDHPVKGMYWDIPGGRLQKGESQMAALLREVEEETGINSFSEIDPFMTAITDIRNGDIGLIFSFFLMHVAETFTPILSAEHVDFAWSTPLQAAEKLKHYPSIFIERIKNVRCHLSGLP